MSTSAPETDLAQYYALRAHEYEAVYAKPERQVDIAQDRKSTRLNSSH